MRFSTVLPLFALLPSAFSAASTLYTSSVAYCSEPQGIQLNSLDVIYHKANESISFTFNVAATDPTLSVNANLYINAYGMSLINQTVDICSLVGGVLCPLPQLNFSGYGTYPVPSDLSSQIPGLAWSVPNLEAYARIELHRTDNNSLALCVQAPLSNGLTTYHLAIPIVTGIFTAIALIIGVWHAALVNSPSPAQYRWFDVLFLFQTAASTGLLHLNYPSMYIPFTENFAWAFALFSSNNIRNSINKMRYSTGGSLPGTISTNVTTINRSFSPYNTNAVSIDDLINTIQQLQNLQNSLPGLGGLFGRNLLKRALPIAYDVSYDATGIPPYVEYKNDIVPANVFTVIFFWFLAFWAIYLFVHVILFIIVALAARKHNIWALGMRKNFRFFSAGNALRVCLIFFFPVWIFGFYQFSIGDSKLAIFFAAFSLAITFLPFLAVFLVSIFRHHRRTSPTAPGVSSLYTSYSWFHSAGTLYRPYRQRYHFFWFAPLVLALIAKAGFIAFAQDNNSGAFAQVIGLMAVELIVLVLSIGFRPHKDKKGDWLGAILSFLRLAAFGLLIAFIPSIGVAAIPRTIIGFVLIAIFGVQTILLLLGLIYNAFYGIFWKRHTTRVEDGFEVEKLEAMQETDSRAPMQHHVDANNFVSSPYAESSRPDRLSRRRSLMDPIPAYETSVHRHHSGLSETPTQVDRDASSAYAAAADGKGVQENRYSDNYSHGHSRPSSRLSAPMSTPLSRRSGQTQYYTPDPTPMRDRNMDWSREGRY